MIIKTLRIIMVISFFLFCFFNQYRKNPFGTLAAIVKYPFPDQNHLALFEKNIQNLKQIVPAGSTVGYFTNQKIIGNNNMTDDVANYYIMQFFFAPAVFAADECRVGYILLNTNIKIQEINFPCNKKSYILVKNTGQIYLYKKK